KEHLAQLAAKQKSKPKAVGDKGKKGDANAKKDDASAKSANTVETHANRPSVETSLPFNVSGDPIPGTKGEEASEMAVELEKSGSVLNDVGPLETGYAVMQLKDVSVAKKEDWDKARDNYLSGMRNRKQLEALTAYIRQLRSKLGSEVKYETSI